MFTHYPFRCDRLTLPTYLACGVFDGIHCGHRWLLDRTRQLANEHAGAAVAMTFDPHPRAVLTAAEPPPILLPLAQRLKMFAALGFDGAATLNFTPEIAQLTAEKFIDLLQREFPLLRGLVVGAGWRFGRAQGGGVIELRRLAVERGWRLEMIPPVIFHDEKISSSRIRQALAEGNLHDAGLMLGRDFSLVSEVIHGREIGRTLGFPTANLALVGKAPLALGIYAAEVFIASDTHKYAAAAYVGDRRTHSAGYSVEAHLLDFCGDLYGKIIDVRFFAKIAEDRQFSDSDTLRAQIQLAVNRVREFFAAQKRAENLDNAP